MIRRGVAEFTLDTGSCPRWLFERMVSLGRSMIEVIVEECGPDEFIRRISDPVWFQSLGTVLAFDWNASGLTTILTASLKESIRGMENKLGIFICGGKGKTSLKTPEQIERWSRYTCLEPVKVENLIYNSRMVAKVDNSLVQDGYTLYHHSFFFSKSGLWAVVQQGMNKESRSARRYHWFSQKASDIICEPHSGIASVRLKKECLNLTAEKSRKTRDMSVEMLNTSYTGLIKDIQILRKHSNNMSRMVSFRQGEEENIFLHLEDKEFKYHPVLKESFTYNKYLERILWKASNMKPDGYESFLSLKGVGPKTVRALSLVSEVIYGAEPSYTDPARYSYAHGGKDGTPYPVDKENYDMTISFFANMIRKMKIPASQKNKITKKLLNS